MAARVDRQEYNLQRETDYGDWEFARRIGKRTFDALPMAQCRVMPCALPTYLPRFSQIGGSFISLVR